MKKKLALIMAAIMLLSTVLCACGDTAEEAPAASSSPASESAESPAAAAPVSEDTAIPAAAEKQLTVIDAGDPETLDPARNSSEDGGNKIIHLFECLLNVGENCELIPRSPSP